jgi:hypothetical protein
MPRTTRHSALATAITLRSGEDPEALEADEVAPSLRWATARPERAGRSRNGQRAAERGQFNDEPPTY